jgi:hypothetical protein
MAIHHEINSACAVARIIGEGRLTMPAMIAAVDRLAEAPEYRSSYAVIFDLRAADYVAELSDGEAFVGVLKRRMSDFQGSFALVVPEPLHFLARLYSVLAAASGFDRMRCFTDMEDACAWCGIAQQNAELNPP